MIYTVFGVVDNTTSPRKLTVAAVCEGEINADDNDPGDETAQRWSDYFTADSVNHAEELAHAAVLGAELNEMGYVEP